MDYSISETFNKDSTPMNITNLDEIETHYGEIFSKVESTNLIYVFQGSIFKKEDNCNLFLKYLMNVIEYYFDQDKKLRLSRI